MPDKHDLHAEFPEYKEQIHQLKAAQQPLCGAV